MLDLQFIVENTDAVAENCRNRGIGIDLERLLALRDRRRDLITETEEIHREQKAASSQDRKSVV